MESSAHFMGGGAGHRVLCLAARKSPKDGGLGEGIPEFFLRGGGSIAAAAGARAVQSTQRCSLPLRPHDAGCRGKK